jgi:hypothetical protein
MRSNITLAGLIAFLPLGLLLSLSRPTPTQAMAGDELLAECRRIYDASACTCAVNATVAERGPLPEAAGRPAVVAGPPPAGASRVESTRVMITLTSDFVRLVQGCMGGAGAPVD